MATTQVAALNRRPQRNARTVLRSGAARAACVSSADLFERLGGNGSPNPSDTTAAAKVCSACALGETCAFRVKDGGRR
ncbi:hypothetical protein ACFVV7_33860 [Streptomyces globisporus]|uniref:hypothetical protein n=1 Tax=Streptomyces globisporus TaxID=1908 RepID=UPI0036D9FA39